MTRFPTALCRYDYHEMSGACYHCCETCNYDRHVCHFCGEWLRHNDVDIRTESVHECYVRCECGHIGHEHFATSCRGGEYTLTVTKETDCACTEFRPTEESLTPRHKREKV